jgi:hypothetical protein
MNMRCMLTFPTVISTLFFPANDRFISIILTFQRLQWDLLHGHLGELFLDISETNTVGKKC